MNFSDVVGLFRQAAANFTGQAFFGSGTLKQLNDQGKQYPLIWLVEPMSLNNAYEGQDVFREGFNIRVRFVTSTNSDATDDTENYTTTKILADSTIKIFRDTQQLSIENYTLTQKYRTSDDVHIGWEATFVLVSYVEPGDCCELSRPLEIPADPNTTSPKFRVTNPVNGDVFVYDSSTGYWENETAPWVLTFNGRTGVVTSQAGDYDTGMVAENGNLYWTAERTDDRVSNLIQNGTGISWVYDDLLGTLTPTVSLSAFSTTNLSEGSNLYWTQARFNTAFAAKSTTDLSEGTNLYFTNERVDDRVAALIQSAASNVITWTYDDALGTLTPVVQSASGSTPGILNGTTQSIGGNKTWTGAATFGGDITFNSNAPLIRHSGGGRCRFDSTTGNFTFMETQTFNVIIGSSTDAGGRLQVYGVANSTCVRFMTDDGAVYYEAREVAGVRQQAWNGKTPVARQTLPITATAADIATFLDLIGLSQL